MDQTYRDEQKVLQQVKEASAINSGQVQTLVGVVATDVGNVNTVQGLVETDRGSLETNISNLQSALNDLDSAWQDLVNKKQDDPVYQPDYNPAGDEINVLKSQAEQEIQEYRQQADTYLNKAKEMVQTANTYYDAASKAVSEAASHQINP